MATHTFYVPAIHCEGCAHTIVDALEPVEGVEGTDVDLDRRAVIVRGSADEGVLRKVLAAAGYPAR
jgi:copper chaperone